MGFIPLPLAALLIRVVMSSVKVHGALSYTCVFLFYLGLVSLKVLNSIVLLGKSCVYVKRANMEDKLFDRPNSAPSRKTPSRADQDPSPAPPGVSSPERIPDTSCRTTSTSCRTTSTSCRTTSPSASTSCRPSSSSTSVTTQPSPRTDTLPVPPTATITTKTTPPGASSPGSRPPSPPPEPEPPNPPEGREEEEKEEEDEDEGEEEEEQGASEQKHRTSKKDLLEIDRFTICGNRID